MLSSILKAKLLDRLSAPTESFAKLGDTVQTAHGPLTYIDRGGSVLSVAHLDYVRWTDPSFSRRGNTVYCPQLDDRLGVFVALDVLPALGVTADVLLTDSEEIGQSTAQYFDSPKDYNWMVQFDRAGTDVVMYNYDCESNRTKLESHDFACGFGSFSDICWLAHLGVSGFNVGTGYYRQHTKDCYALLRETWTNAIRFVEFWREFGDIKIPSPERERESLSVPRGHGAVAYSRAWDWRAQNYDLADRDETYCPDCGEFSADNYHCIGCGAEFAFCESCGETLGNQDWECVCCGAERRDVSLNNFIRRLDVDAYYELAD